MSLKSKMGVGASGLIGLVGALAFHGCATEGNQGQGDGKGPGSINLALTLPDGTVINSVTYTVTGGPENITETATFDVALSSELRFRVGDLPVGPGYNMALSATTTDGVTCAGLSPFSVDDNDVGTLDMTLTCDGTAVVEVDNNGDISVTVNVVNADAATCPVVAGITALPLEVFIDSSLELEGHVTSDEGVVYAWTGAGGTFATPSAATTNFTCLEEGPHELDFTISKDGCDDSSQTVTVTCSYRPTFSSAPSYIVPVAAGVTTQAILTVGDSPNNKPNGTPYRLVGLPDGLGAYDNGDDTFTLLSNHELGNTAGIARAHGGIGAFVSSWIVRKSDLAVLYGEDLTTSVQVWNPGTSSYGPGTNVAFGRFCSADLAPVSAFYDAATSTGYNGQLFTNGEETGAEGKAWAHGLDGTTWELPRLGKASWENIVPSPEPQLKTIVVGIDDTTPGQVYVYVGNKTNSGSPVDRAGLTNGTLYGVAVTGFPTEPSATGIPTGPFTLASLGNVENTTGAVLETQSTAAGVTRFNRPEDGAWDPSAPNDFYFVTTNTPTTPSRLWRLRFQDITQPELGGTITMALDGTEGVVMLDNIGIDTRGHIVLQEDVGNIPRLGQIFRYDIATDTLTTIAQHDPALFTPGAPGQITQDEEASGAIDATDLLGAGWWLMSDQAHTSAGNTELVERGQFVALFDPGSL